MEKEQIRDEENAGEVEDPVQKALKEVYYNAEDHGSDGRVEKLFRSAKKMKVVNGIRM